MSYAAMMLIACVIDVALGWPDRLFARIGHPVTWLGAMVTRLEMAWNTGAPQRRFWAGAGMTLVVVIVAAGSGLLAQSLLPSGGAGFLIGALLAWPLVALRAMNDHVAAVASPLAVGNVGAARQAVAMIVGRDPRHLDAAGIARSALESLAENSSDGIVAPVFWGLVAGLPGIAAYKAINTLDSMIGHRNPRYEQFGKVAARADDLANLIPARLTALLFVLVSRNRRRALGVMWQDARRHRSPNAGWPEAAMAGALGRRLSGPRHYGERIAAEPWLNAAAPDPGAGDLAAGLRLYRRAMAAMLALLGVIIFAGG